MCVALEEGERRHHNPKRSLSILPFRDANRCALPELGLNIELVHQTSHSWQAQSEPPGSRKANLQCLFHISDSRTAVQSNDLDTPPRRVRNGSNRDFTALRIADDVPGQFRDCSGDEAEFGKHKSDILG